MNKTILLLLILVTIGSVNASWCYQETANVSTTCGGVNTGTYSVTGTWYYGYPLVWIKDGDWGTMYDAAVVNTTAYYYVNYSLPIGTQNSSLFKVKLYGGNTAGDNYTLSSSCMNQPLQIRAISNKYTGNYSALWYCKNATDWQHIANTSSVTYANGASLYEEAMWWNISRPNVTQVNITPLVNNGTQNLTSSYACTQENPSICNVTVQYDWFKNDTQLAINSSLLTSGNYTVGDRIIASIRTSDGTVWSEWKNSTFVTIGDLIKPSANSINVTLDVLTTLDTTTIEANCTDAGGIATVQFQIIDGNGIYANYTGTFSTGNIYTYTYQPPTAGTNYVSAYCIDGGTNINQTNSISFLVYGAGGGGAPVIYAGKLQKTGGINTDGIWNFFAYPVHIGTYNGLTIIEPYLAPWLLVYEQTNLIAIRLWAIILLVGYFLLRTKGWS